MSNLCIELGRLPAPGTPLFFKVGAMEIAGPSERGDAPASCWTVSAGFPVTETADLRQFPEGFSIAFTVAADELPSAGHGALALSRYFGFEPQRILSSDDPLATQVPNLDAFLFGRPPSAGTPQGNEAAGQEGTTLRQPAVSQVHTMPWFMTEILRASGLLPVEEAPEEVMEEVEEVPVPTQAQTLVLQPGALAPLTPIKVEKKVTPRKPRKKVAKTKQAATN